MCGDGVDRWCGRPSSGRSPGRSARPPFDTDPARGVRDFRLSTVLGVDARGEMLRHRGHLALVGLRVDTEAAPRCAPAAANLYTMKKFAPGYCSEFAHIVDVDGL